MITIINYGLGNIGSIQNMLQKLGASTQLTSDPNDIMKAEKILLPGVGAFDAAMEKIDSLELREVLTEKAMKSKIPFLGICLGMQLLTSSSEEGSLEGLNFIPGFVRKFPPSSELKIPHMGWNTVSLENPSPITKGLTSDSRFYFVHSFYVQVKEQSKVAAKTEYGISFDSIISADNIFGAQFHPEKSHRFGMQLFKNFIEL